MNHLDILGTFEDYTFVYYERDERLTTEYHRMEKLVLDETGGVPSQHPLEVGILLEKNNCAIAGAFLNLSLIPTGLLILTMFVNEEYRRKGIHTKLHDLIDQIGMFHNKKTVFSNFHASNRVMVEFVSKKQNYEPFVYVVKRPVKK